MPVNKVHGKAALASVGSFEHTIPPPFPHCKLVIIGASAGGSAVVRDLLADLTASYPLPVVLVQHLHPDDRGLLVENLDSEMTMPVVGVLDKMPLRPGRLHVAPADYHLLLESDSRLALSLDAPVHWSRPSIDLFFESAALIFKQDLCAILLTGANEDGAEGMQLISRLGGRTLVQDPASAAFPRMPQAAIDQHAAQWVLSVDRIAESLKNLGAEVSNG